MSTIRKLASQTVLYGFTYFAARLLNFFLFPYYTRIFSTADYGSMAEIYAYITFLNVLYSYGMETGYFYFANQNKEYEEVAGTAFSSLLFSSLILSGGICLLSPLIADSLGYGAHINYIIFAAGILFFDTISIIPFAQLRKENRSGRFALLKFLNVTLFLFFNFFFLGICPYILNNSGPGTLHTIVRNIYDPRYNLAYAFLANLISSGLILVFLLPEMRRIPFKINKALWNKMLKYSWPILILGFAGMVNETLDRILLKWLLLKQPGMNMVKALEQVGIYSACYKLSIFMTLAIQSFRYAAEPFFFAQMKDNNNKDIYARMLKYFSFVTSLIFLGVMLFIPVLMKIVGKNFRGAEAVVPILLLANLFLGIFIYLSQWYKQTAKTIYGAYISIGGALITLIVNFIFIPYYGYMASAWATLICYFSMAAASYILGQKYFPVAYQTGRIGLYIGLAIGLYVLSAWLRNSFFGGWNVNVYGLNIVLFFGYILVFIALEKPRLRLRMPTRSK
jgi:O-antigen/teichoic acid export membrane protein